LVYHQPLDPLISQVQKLRWIVHSTHPTIDTDLIERYLARYINRVAVSPSRLNYVKQSQHVELLYNDYLHQQAGFAPPKEIKYLKPLEAIHQIIQHVLPAHFQKSRKYGLHHHSNVQRNILPSALKRNGHTVRTVFQILHQLLKTKPFHCSSCGSDQYVITQFDPDSSWIIQNIKWTQIRPPPQTSLHMTTHYKIP
jgi:hypothetical protein